MNIDGKMMLSRWKIEKKTLAKWAQKNKTRSRLWENRWIMMKEDGYRWEDDVELVKSG